MESYSEKIRKRQRLEQNEESLKLQEQWKNLLRKCIEMRRNAEKEEYLEMRRFEPRGLGLGFDDAVRQVDTIETNQTI